MTTGPGVWLGDLTWPEAKARFDAGAVDVVPIGAGSKEHGHHLPLKTDYLLARELSERVMASLPVVVAPVVTLGYFPAFVRYPGSQHLRSETFIALLTDVFSKLARDGVQNMAVINTGVSTERRFAWPCGIDEDTLKSFCLENGPAYAHPRRIVIVDHLPLNGVGKVDRGIVQRELEQTLGSETGEAGKRR